MKSINHPGYSNGRILLTAIALLIGSVLLISLITQGLQRFMIAPATLLTDPFLQLPTANSVRVVWFTEFEGDRHLVQYGTNLENQVQAQTTQLSRVREDQESRVGQQTENGQVFTGPVARSIWRHEAEVSGLQPNQRVPYRVTSITRDGQTVRSNPFSLAPLPRAGTPLQILLTSDHQSMPMTPANLQKVIETMGQVDAVFLAGDLVNIPDRASEWFDDNRGRAFFPSLQGRAGTVLEWDERNTRYTGGAIIQSSPLFPAVGNHEVMGRFSQEAKLGDQYNDPYPLKAAIELYAQQAKTVNPTNDATTRAAWLKNNTFNSDTYEEIFSLPDSSPGSKRYYAITFGDVRLVSLYLCNIWRVPNLNQNSRGRFRERDEDLNAPERWGYGQHIFEPITPGSPQYEWLKAELNSPEFRQAKYKIVMFHHPPHSLGDNIVPAFTNPVQIIDRAPDQSPISVRYEYPLEQDYLIRDIVPLLEAANVQLVFYGHSHVWNRFTSPSGVHFLESSNVGNTYNVFTGEKRRFVPVGFQEAYIPTGDPNGLQPVVPTLAPFKGSDDQPQPYIASNEITAFSILDTGRGVVSSYYFDTRQPGSAVVKFDEFSILRPTAAKTPVSGEA